METTSNYDESSHCEANKVQGFTHMVISLLSIAANSIVITTIVMRRQLHLPTLWLISLMALVDLLFAIYYLVFVVPSAYLGCFAYSDSFLGVAIILRIAFNCQSIQNTMLVCLDRYISVNWPLRYVHVVTNRTCIAAVLTSFLMNLTFSTVWQLSSRAAFYNSVTSISLQDIQHVYGAAILGVFIWGYFGVIMFCSVKLLSAVLRSRNKIVSTGQSVHPLAKSSFMVLISSFVFFVTYIPIPVIYIIALALGKENMPLIAFRLTSMVLNSGGLWNVFIYCATYRPFREALLSLMCKKFYRRYRQAAIVNLYDRTKELENEIMQKHQHAQR